MCPIKIIPSSIIHSTVSQRYVTYYPENKVTSVTAIKENVLSVTRIYYIKIL